MTALALAAAFAGCAHTPGAQLGKRGRVFLGVVIADGAVARVVPDSPASAAGVRPGDRIVSVGDQPVESPAQLAAIVSKLELLAEAPLAVEREVELQTLALVPTLTWGPGHVYAADPGGERSSPRRCPSVAPGSPPL